jgi:hypothetical protein
MRLLGSAISLALLIGGSIAGCSAPPEAPKPPAALAPAQMTPGQKFLKAKLAELDSIRESSEFQEYKWSQAGPNPGWPQRLNEEADKRTDLSAYEKGGVGMLAMLAAEYASSDGVDNAETARTRRDVEEIINTPPAQ